MGNVIIGQSGGPTAVINSALAGAIREAQAHGIEKIYGMHHGIEGFLKEDLIDLKHYIHDERELSLLKRTPSSFLGTCRYKLPKLEDKPEEYEKILTLMRKYDIEYFLYIGGNDSMDTVKQLSLYAEQNQLKERFIGIPKTIDNDLPITDHCPGFGSAAKYIAVSMKEVIRDDAAYGYTKPTVVVMEIMGRNAGWLTAASSLAKGPDCPGPDMIYLPEVDFDMDNFLSRVENEMKTKDSLTIAVSEGVHLADGRLVCELAESERAVDAFGHVQLSGTAQFLSNQIAAETGLKTRAIELSVLQRCAAHLASRCDLDEAFNCGILGARAAFQGETGKMVTIQVDSRDPYVASYALHDVDEIANLEKKVPLDWIGADGSSVTDDFVSYCRPLIRGSVTPYAYMGVPLHMTLDPQA